MSEWENRPKVQVVCNDSGESSYVRPTYKPIAGEYRARCNGGACMCGAAEYREPEAIEV